MSSTHSFVPPSFVTFTGVDDPAHLPDIKELSSRYSIEWGVLIDSAQAGDELFPTISGLDVIKSQGLRLSAHVCGVPARDIAEGREPEVDLTGFSRLQLNHSREGSSESVVKNAYSFAVSNGLRLALQCQADFPNDSRADWLYDVSFGTGVRPTSWPELTQSHPFCGYSGGFSPDTVVQTLSGIELSKHDYWIDMESGVRTNGALDLDKCEQVCKLVFGK